MKCVKNEPEFTEYYGTKQRCIGKSSSTETEKEHPTQHTTCTSGEGTQAAPKRPPSNTGSPPQENKRTKWS